MDLTNLNSAINATGAAVSVLVATGGAWLTLRKGRADLRSQIQQDASAWIKGQRERLGEQDARIDALEAELDAERRFNALVREYLMSDADWHRLVMRLMRDHGIEPPEPPAPPARPQAPPSAPPAAQAATS